MKINNLELGQLFSLPQHRYTKIGTAKGLDIRARKTLAVNSLVIMHIICLYSTGAPL